MLIQTKSFIRRLRYTVKDTKSLIPDYQIAISIAGAANTLNTFLQFHTKTEPLVLSIPQKSNQYASYDLSEDFMQQVALWGSGGGEPKEYRYLTKDEFLRLFLTELSPTFYKQGYWYTVDDVRWQVLVTPIPSDKPVFTYLATFLNKITEADPLTTLDQYVMEFIPDSLMEILLYLTASYLIEPLSPEYSRELHDKFVFYLREYKLSRGSKEVASGSISYADPYFSF